MDVLFKNQRAQSPYATFTAQRELRPQGMRQLPVHAAGAPGPDAATLPCSSHLPRHRFHPHNLHRSQIHRNGPCPVSTNQSPAGWLTPLPSSCFEAAHNHSSQGRWVMWSGGFRVTSSHSSSATTRPGRSHLVCIANSGSLTWPRSPYLHPLIRIHFAALDQLNAERLLQGPQGHRGGLGKKGGRVGGKAQTPVPNAVCLLPESVLCTRAPNTRKIHKRTMEAALRFTQIPTGHGSPTKGP